VRSFSKDMRGDPTGHDCFCILSEGFEPSTVQLKCFTSPVLPACRVRLDKFNQIQIYGMAVDSPHAWESRAFAKEN
jgi:hypothetical protein